MKTVTTLQVKNVSTKTKEKAEKVAISQGFSSVQDAVRMFISEYSKGKIHFGIREEIVTPAMARMYQRDIDNFEKDLAAGKAHEFRTVDEMIATLTA